MEHYISLNSKMHYQGDGKNFTGKTAHIEVLEFDFVKVDGLYYEMKPVRNNLYQIVPCDQETFDEFDFEQLGEEVFYDEEYQYSVFGQTRSDDDAVFLG